MSDYKNLRLKSVNYGFGWHEYDNPSTDDISNILVRLDDRFNQLEQENEMMREALEFYADTLSWVHIPCETKWNWFKPIIKPEVDCSQVKNNEWCSYGGKRAREVLAKLTRGSDE